MKSAFDKYKKKLLWFLICSIYLMIGIDTLRIIITGNIPFWYDPARDILLAKDNLHKLTFIGPTTGIPGLFYGPYWIWLLSLGLLFSSDPKIITILVAAIPYLILLPLLLFMFYRKTGNALVIASLYFLFMFKFGQSYGSQLWNPNLAPILFLLLTYLLVFHDYTKLNKNNFIRIIISGFVMGLIVNFHASFGIAILLGVLLYVLIRLFISTKVGLTQIIKFINKRTIFTFLGFVSGIVIAFLPFLIFEVRHNFLQVKAFLDVLLKSGINIQFTAMSDAEIIQAFVDRNSQLIQLSSIPLYVLSLLLLILLIIKILKKDFRIQFYLLLFVLLNTFSLFYVYFSSKNPVWPYHFVAVEMFGFILLLTVLTLSKYGKMMLYVWTAIIILMQIPNVIDGFKADPLKSGSLAAKENNVKMVYDDAGKNDFAVYVYSSAIYYYDYAYLFQWLGFKELSYRPELEKPKDITYLIIPQAKESEKIDFIHYRTSDEFYATEKTWNTKDGTLILKRVKYDVN